MDKFLERNFKTSMERDFFKLFCGDLISEGSARIVYAHATDPNVVIKIECRSQSFQNVIEWETWNRVRNTQYAKWFAPCINISPCGIVLLQTRTQAKELRHYPDKVPAFFTDLKYMNYGFIGKQFVCHDYGYNLLMEKGMRKTLMGVDWYDKWYE